MLAIGSARTGDLEAILRLEALSFAHDRLSRRSLARLLASRNEVIVARAAAEIAGYGLVLFRRGSRLARLYSLAVAPAMAGKGIGQGLLAACEASAALRGCIVLRLEVRRDNDRAIRFYTAAGYAQFGHHEAYYADGQAALRMQKPL
jgi:ribosomal protein S18 acetylase RimI-like enzyme